MAAATNTGSGTSPRSACHSPYRATAVAASDQELAGGQRAEHAVGQLDIGGNAHGRGHEELLRRGGRDGGVPAA